MSRMVRHLRSNVVAYLALFVALGGAGAYAADKIGSRDIAKNAIKSKHIKNNKVSSADLKDGDLTGADLADESVGSTDVADESLGGADVDGLTGDDVADGSMRLADLVVGTGTVTHDFGSIGANSCQQPQKTIPQTVQPTDVILLAPTPTPGDASFTFGLMADAFPDDTNTATTTIELRGCNTGGVALDPPSTDFRYYILR